MKNKFLTLVLIISGLGFNAHAETILRCAVKKVSADGTGARINLIQNANGTLRANLIFGTTVSGTMYNITEVGPGVYQGAIKTNGKFWIKLAVSSSKAENRYIKGFKASLNVIYPDLRKRTGFGTFNSEASDEFVCGKQIRGYRD